MSSELSANLVALNTIVYREVRRFTRIWPQTLLPPAITMVLYFVIFGNLIGRQIGDMGGFTYMEYIVPGLIMMSVITNAYGNVVSSFFGSKFQRSVEELLVSPVSPHAILPVSYTHLGVGGGLAAVRLDQRGFPDHFARTDVIDDQFPPVRPVEHGIEVSAEDQADEVFRVVLEEQDVLVAQPALRRMGRHVPQQIGQPVQQRAPLQQGVVAVSYTHLKLMM